MNSIQRTAEQYLRAGHPNDLLCNKFGDSFLGKISLLKSSIKDLDDKSLEACFSNTYQALSTCGDGQTSNPVDDITKHVENYFDTTVTAPKTHLVIGCRGVGKSTLLSYTTKIAFRKSKVAKDVICLKVDTQYSSEGHHAIESAIIKKINKELHELVSKKSIQDIFTNKKILRIIFADEIRELAASEPNEVNDDRLLMEIFPLIRVDERLCLTRRLEFISKKYRLCVILDNVDHSDSIDTEKNIFRIGKSLIQGIQCKYIISLRRPTFSTHFGLLTRDPYNKTIVNPPQIKDVLKKKVNYLVGSGDIEPTLMNGTVVIDTAVFAEAALDLFDKEIFIALNRLCNGNIRRILTCFLEMLCSGHITDDTFYKSVLEYTDKKKITSKPDAEGKQPKISLYACLPGLLSPDCKYYIEQNNSLILNIYDNGIRTDKYNCVIRYRILCVIESATCWEESKGHHGGIEYIDLIDMFSNAGYSREAAENAIILLCNFQIIRTTSFNAPGKTENLVITYSGTFYLDTLLQMSQYIQIIHHSTWLPKGRCADLQDTHTIDARFSQIRKFVDHIEDVEDYEKLHIEKEFFRNYIEQNQLHVLLRDHHDRELGWIKDSMKDV